MTKSKNEMFEMEDLFTNQLDRAIGELKVETAEGQQVEERIPNGHNYASWTCHRSFDGALAQLDFVARSSRMTLVRRWCDHCISVGLDHRCVHCIIAFMSQELQQRSLTKRVRNWMPRLDSSDQPSEFQYFVRTSLTSVQNHGRIALENILVEAPIATGHSQVRTLQFAPCTKSTMSERTVPSDSIIASLSSYLE